MTVTDFTRAKGPWSDVVQGLRWRELWTFLAWRRLRDSYRRTKLGPLWITIGVFVFVGGFSFIGAELFDVEYKSLLPELAVGFVIWQFVSGSIANGCASIRTYASVRQSRAVPFTVFIAANVSAEVLRFFHYILIWPVVFLVVPFNPHVSWAAALFLVLTINLFFVSFVLAILCARIADMQYVVSSTMQLLFFMTPVIWPIDRLKGAEWVYQYNPLFYFVHPLKAAVLGLPIETAHIVGLGALTIINAVLFWLVFASTYKRIQFWL